MIDEGIATLLNADSGLSALVGTRIYMGTLPVSPTLPALTYRKVSSERELSHSGSMKAARSRYQFDCHATSLLTAKQIAEALRALFHSYQGIVGSETFFYSQIVNEIDLHDPDLGYQVAVDIIFTHKET